MTMCCCTGGRCSPSTPRCCASRCASNTRSSSIEAGVTSSSQPFPCQFKGVRRAVPPVIKTRFRDPFLKADFVVWRQVELRPNAVG